MTALVLLHSASVRAVENTYFTASFMIGAISSVAFGQYGATPS
ncbi:MAG: hypothetical protein ACRDVP_06040 [Acidimicrobiales bacterium]